MQVMIYCVGVSLSSNKFIFVAFHRWWRRWDRLRLRRWKWARRRHLLRRPRRRRRRSIFKRASENGKLGTFQSEFVLLVQNLFLALKTNCSPLFLTVLDNISTQVLQRETWLSLLIVPSTGNAFFLFGPLKVQIFCATFKVPQKRYYSCCSSLTIQSFFKDSNLLIGVSSVTHASSLLRRTSRSSWPSLESNWQVKQFRDWHRKVFVWNELFYQQQMFHIPLGFVSLFSLWRK